MATVTYRMEQLDCANCAAKIEQKFNAHPQVETAVITFTTRQLRITAPDPDALVAELEAIARTVEPDVRILPVGSGTDCGHGQECSCGHSHTHECAHSHGNAHSHAHSHGSSHWSIWVGGILFALSFLLEWLGVISGPVLGIRIAAWGILGSDILGKAWKNLTKGHVLDENFLMSLASLGAFCVGEAAEGVGVMLFYRIGEFFEERAMARSRSQIMEAVDLRPETVTRIEGESFQTVPAGDARPGDLLLVRPGDRIPLDGTVVSGESQIDTSPITGEPVPVQAKAGVFLLSGCVNGPGQLILRVEKPLSESMVTRILSSVETAAASKPKMDRFITRFARIYTPIVVGAAVLIATIPSAVTGNWHYWVYTALSFLVMSCPCALVLSVPLAFFAGIGEGSRQGILFKGGVSMEAMGKIKTVVMDKTGTLTKGDFRVQKIAGGLDMLALCASCEQHSTHPIAASITAAAREKGITLFHPDSLEEIAGQGIRATVDGKTVLCGNARLLEENGIAISPAPDTGTVVYVAVDGSLAGYLVIADTVKEGSTAAVAALKAQGLTTAMLTGDSEAEAKAVASVLGIDRVRGGLLPHQKLEQLQQLRQETGGVMFVGDGINDAPVLAGADVGAAMGSGADAAIEAADVVFMTSEPGAIPEALKIARRTTRTARQNVVFALGVKAAVMVLGLLGHASMWLAVFADSGVAMLCVLNSIRSLYRKK